MILQFILTLIQEKLQNQAGNGVSRKYNYLVKSGLYFRQISCYEKAVFVVCWTKVVKRSTSVTKGFLGSGIVPQDCNLD